MPHKPLPKGTILVKRGNFRGWSLRSPNSSTPATTAVGTYGQHNGKEILDGDIGVIMANRGGWSAEICVMRTRKVYNVDICNAWRQVTPDNSKYLTQKQKEEAVKARLFVASLT